MSKLLDKPNEFDYDTVDENEPKEKEISFSSFVNLMGYLVFIGVSMYLCISVFNFLTT